ncbi:MAG: hypothetical protein ACPGD6_10350, partial [bacterium]
HLGIQAPALKHVSSLLKLQAITLGLYEHPNQPERPSF